MKDALLLLQIQALQHRLTLLAIQHQLEEDLLQHPALNHNNTLQQLFNGMAANGLL